MRLDHIAYRVKNRDKTVESIKSLFGYNIGEEFTIDFDDGSQAQCVALTPPERLTEDTYLEALWTVHGNLATYYHLAPEIFVSEGTPDSIVDKWVKERGGIGRDSPPSL